MLCLPFMLTFTSCSDDNNTNSEWRETNETAFTAISTSTEYKAVTTPQGPGAIYRKVLKSGDGTESPLSTARVKARYKGSFYDGTVFDPGTTGNDVPVYFPSKTATNFQNNGVISGFSIALQNMVVGDKWEVWIPWVLGYGEMGSGSIPGFSTLVFEVELLEIEQYPK